MPQFRRKRTFPLTLTCQRPPHDARLWLSTYKHNVLSPEPVDVCDLLSCELGLRPSAVETACSLTARSRTLLSGQMQEIGMSPHACQLDRIKALHADSDSCEQGQCFLPASTSTSMHARTCVAWHTHDVT